MKHKKTRIMRVICVMAVIVFLFTGCKGSVDENGSKISDDGRSYGGVIHGTTGDEVSTAFFDVTVNEASKYTTYQFADGLYQADEGNTYLVLKLTIKNTYDKDLPMSITDFVLDFDGKKPEERITGFGNADLNNTDFMDNIFTLKQGESITMDILFTVADKIDYTLGYTEYYEDEFKGNQIQIAVKPEKK